MNITLSKTRTVGRTLIIDAMLLCAICIVPTLSHLLSLPFYMLNPMTLCLLAGMLLVTDTRNAFMLAVLLPVVSMLISGMPAPLKCVCMIVELLTITGVYQLTYKRYGSFLSILGAMICGKVVFYILKMLLISPAVLIGTSIWIQLIVTVVFAVLFNRIHKIKQ